MRCKGESTAMPSQCAISSDFELLLVSCAVHRACIVPVLRHAAGMHHLCRTDAHGTPRAGHSSHGAGNVSRRAMSRSTAKSRANCRDHCAGRVWLRVAVWRVRHAKLREVSLLRAAPPAVREIVRVPRLPCVALPHGAAAHGRALPPRVHACACARPCAAGATASHPQAHAPPRTGPVYTNTRQNRAT
jgi:hypothetical protein